MARGFEWDGDLLARAIQDLPDKVDMALAAICHYHAPRIEGEMKTGATWTDRTSNARNGLFARPVIEKGKTYAIVLAHSVPYGIWLEVRSSGRFAIIVPSIRNQGPLVMRSTRGLLGRLGAP